MEKIICNHCGAHGLVLNLHGCYHCSVCKCVVFEEQDEKYPDVVEDDYADTEFITRVSFHTDNNRFAMGFPF